MKATARYIAFAIAAASTQPAFAQQQDGTPSANPADKAQAVDDIVVTARKRNESLQEVPIAVSAFSGANLDQRQAKTLDALSFAVPNLAITKNQTTANSAQIYLRGIGQDDSTPTNEPGVGVYLDDVYLARSQGALLDLLDVERVEVLRGPQGTLYGRNSTGGAIKLITRRPDLDKTDVVADITAGSFGRVDARGAISVPLVPGQLAAKVEGLSFNNDGYVTRLSDGSKINGTKRWALRGSLLWKPGNAVGVYVTGDYTKDRSGITAPTPLTIPPAGVGETLPGNRQPLFGYYVSDPNVPDLYRYNGGGVSGTVTVDNSFGQIKSVTAYREFSNTFWSDLRGRSATSGGGTDLFRVMSQNQVTQELQLASQGNNRFSYVLGLFYLHENVNNADTFLRQHNYVQKAESFAGYADLSYNVTDALAVTAGGRYTWDRKTITETATTLVTTFSINDYPIRFHAFTPKLGVSYKPSHDLLLYASWQKGYKAGSFQGFPQRITDITDNSLAPEKVDSFEGGFKATLFAGRVTFNGAAFYLNYQSIQLALLDSGLNFVARSAGARAWGTEWEVSARLAPGLTAGLSLGTFSSKIDRVDLSDPLTAPLNGNRLKHVPKFNTQASLAYERQVNDGIGFFLGGNVGWVSSIFFDAANTPYNFQKGHERIDAYAGLKFGQDKFRLTVGVQNLSDVRYALTGTAAGQGSLFPAAPRTWSVTGRVKF